MMPLVLGIGCRRGVSLSEIEEAVNSFLASGIDDVACIASCDLKADEAALLEFARRKGKPLRFFRASELGDVETPNPSERVKERVGTASVCEAAALLASGGKLLLEKTKFGNITLALAGKD